MAFNVSSFKSSMDDFLRPFTYVVVVSPPGATTDLILRTESISLPGVSFAEIDVYKPYGNGLAISIPHTATVQEISCTHTIDDKGEVLQTFYNWANQTVNLNGQDKFSAYYYNDYTVDMTILVFDLKGSIVKRYQLKRAYVASYDQVQMSWESGSEIAKLSVNYKFESFEIS